MVEFLPLGDHYLYNKCDSGHPCLIRLFLLLIDNDGDLGTAIKYKIKL